MVKRIHVKTGDRYGQLTVVKEAERGRTPKGFTFRRFQCRCACGKEVTSPLANLTKGHTKSCGCIVGKNSNPRHGHRPRGDASPTYQSWQAMKSRCCCLGDHAYSQYGGRGIKVCEKWMRFEGFLADMGQRPDGHSLDRIDNDGDYEPSNCRWATRSQQQRNTRGNRLLTFRGETMCVAAWAERIGLNESTLWCRITRSGWSVEDALTRPTLPPNKRRAGTL
jgi:hypothetical protein